MSTDLKTVHDHPATLLEQRKRMVVVTNTTPEQALAAAKALRAYERNEKVTFAALDNDALQAVREAYAETRLDRGIGGLSGEGWSDLADAVNALLGLED
jgi:hypothetical protein